MHIFSAKQTMLHVTSSLDLQAKDLWMKVLIMMQQKCHNFIEIEYTAIPSFYLNFSFHAREIKFYVFSLSPSRFLGLRLRTLSCTIAALHVLLHLCLFVHLVQVWIFPVWSIFLFLLHAFTYFYMLTHAYTCIQTLLHASTCFNSLLLAL